MKRVDAAIGRLKPHAKEAAEHSHAPYSHFRVGAAVLSGEGKVYRGCNVENASFGLTQCAERAALTAAVCDGAGPGTLEILLIYTPGEAVHSPCGACRQVMHELMTKDSIVISCSDGEQHRMWTHSGYLPDPFIPEALLK